MRVWTFNHYAIPPTMPGGTRHHALARELIARGHAVTVFASNIHYSTGEEVPVDVVLGSSPHLFAALAAHRVARRKRAAFVLRDARRPA
ncbi:MAG: hypothetical protein KY444_05180 [Gemmatimonadetes bacterium]|nr:hypothetical protein [Gemmatimonadota bacterium]